MSRVSDLPLKVRVMASMESSFSYNLTPFQELDEDVVIMKDRVMALDDIESWTIVYEGMPIISYKDDEAHSNKGLLCGISLINKEHTSDLLSMMLDLYPQKRTDIERDHIFSICMLYNGFESHTQHYKGLYLHASKFNHSCSPNCWWEILDKKLYIITNRRVRTGEQLTISYNRQALMCNDKDKRREILSLNHMFLCTCTFCLGNKTIDRCVRCARARKTMLCGACGTVRYCSTECQKEDWTYIHKHLCKPKT
jgi:hypothetical protein